MGYRRSAARPRLVGLATVALALGMTASALAQPAGEIEMEGDPPAEGDAPPPEAAPDEAPPPADEPVVKDPKVARKWLQAANTLVRKGDQLTKQGKADEAKINYDNAATAFAKAIEAGDDLSLHYQLALTVDKAGDSPAAMKHLETVLAAQGIKPEITRKAQAALDEISMKVGLVTLTVVPDHTAVSLAGKPIGEAPLPEPLVLMPGTYVATFTAVGYQPKDLELKVEAGSESERKIELEPVPMNVTKPQELEPELTAQQTTGPARPNMLPLYIGGGATLGLAMLATITGIVAVGKHGQYSDATSPTERDDLSSSGKTFALVTDLALVGAIGAAAFTTYWYMYRYRPEAKALEERQARGPKVDVVPWVQLDAGGVAAVGSF